MAVGLFVMLAGLTLAEAETATAPNPSEDERAIEASLLHHQLNLRGIEQLMADGSWRPLPPPSAPVLIVNLWYHSCKPCLRELPELRRLQQRLARHSKVGFLFIADPPRLSSPDEVKMFWSRPLVELPVGEPCRGTPPTRPASAQSCILELPDTRPARNPDGVRFLAGTLPETRPITLLLDRKRVVRQVFAGMLDGARINQLYSAAERLLKLDR